MLTQEEIILLLNMLSHNVMELQKELDEIKGNPAKIEINPN